VKRCAFLSLADTADWVIDDEHAIGPLAELGWQVDTVPWNDPGRAWEQYDAAVIRSTWDYWHDPEQFTDVLAAIAARTRLANSLALVRWNLVKSYLRDLAERGVEIVPTGFLAGWAGEVPGRWRERFGSEELVLKPLVGANGDDAFRYPADAPRGHQDRLLRRLGDRPCMVQPFRASILEEGEFSLIYFSGEFSHAILKRPAAGEFRSQEERGAEILPVSPEPALLRCAERSLAALDETPLYARADFVRSPAGSEGSGFELMELELVEPSLYLRTDAAAPARFAAAVDRWAARA
jgi:glutathione synthase/RimK-type ligase-like ATP-grasp enzyme